MARLHLRHKSNPQVSKYEENSDAKTRESRALRATDEAKTISDSKAVINKVVKTAVIGSELFVNYKVSILAKTKSNLW